MIWTRFRAMNSSMNAGRSWEADQVRQVEAVPVRRLGHLEPDGLPGDEAQEAAGLDDDGVGEAPDSGLWEDPGRPDPPADSGEAGLQHVVASDVVSGPEADLREPRHFVDGSAFGNQAERHPGVPSAGEEADGHEVIRLGQAQHAEGRDQQEPVRSLNHGDDIAVR